MMEFKNKATSELNQENVAAFQEMMSRILELTGREAQSEINDLKENVSDYIDIEYLTDQVMNTINFANVAYEIKDYIDWDNSELNNHISYMIDNSDISDRVEDTVNDVMDDAIDRRLESHLRGFRVGFTCSIGEAFTDAVTQIVDSINSNLHMRLEAIENNINSGLEVPINNDIQPAEPVNVVTDDAPVGLFNPELMGIMAVSQYVISDINDRAIYESVDLETHQFNPILMWEVYLNAKTSYIESLKGD